MGMMMGCWTRYRVMVIALAVAAPGTMIAQSSVARVADSGSHADSLVDPRGVELLDAANARLLRATSLYAKITSRTFRTPVGAGRGRLVQPGRSAMVFDEASIQQALKATTDTVTFWLSRPGLLHSESPIITPPGAKPLAPDVAIVTPKGQWTYNGMRDTVQFSPVMPGLHWLEDQLRVPIEGFFETTDQAPTAGEWRHAWLTHPLFQSVRYVGVERWNGAPYYVVEWRYAVAAELPEEQNTFTSRAYIGTADTIIRRVVTERRMNGVPYDTTEVRLDSLQLDVAIPAVMFATPPGRPVRQVNALDSDPTTYLGKPWPALTSPAHLLNDSTVHATAELLHDHTLLVLWPWNVHCGSCCVEFPFFERVRAKYRQRGVEFVAINSGDKQEQSDAKRYMEFHHGHMPVLFDAKAWNDIVYTKIPLIILDHDGIVRFAGFYAGEHELERTLDQLLQQATP